MDRTPRDKLVSYMLADDKWKIEYLTKTLIDEGITMPLEIIKFLSKSSSHLVYKNICQVINPKYTMSIELLLLVRKKESIIGDISYIKRRHFTGKFEDTKDLNKLSDAIYPFVSDIQREICKYYTSIAPDSDINSYVLKMDDDRLKLECSDPRKSVPNYYHINFY